MSMNNFNYVKMDSLVLITCLTNKSIYTLSYYLYVIE